MGWFLSSKKKKKRAKPRRSASLMEPKAWDFWWVCVPVCVVMAPVGARFIRDRSRHFVALILYVAIVVQFVWGLIIIPQTSLLLLHTTAVFLVALLLFRTMANGGVRRLEWLASFNGERTGAAS